MKYTEIRLIGKNVTFIIVEIKAVSYRLICYN
jgi:hypothetical protein